MRLNWLLWFSWPITHHTFGKWFFQRLLSSSNSLTDLFASTQTLGEREDFAEEHSCNSTLKSLCSQFTVKMNTLRCLRVYDHSLLELLGFRGTFLGKGHFSKLLSWTSPHPSFTKAVGRSHSSSNWVSAIISPNKASKCCCRHRAHITKDKIQAWSQRKISHRHLWKGNRGMNPRFGKRINTEVVVTWENLVQPPSSEWSHFGFVNANDKNLQLCVTASWNVIDDYRRCWPKGDILLVSTTFLTLVTCAIQSKKNTAIHIEIIFFRF